MTAAPIRALMPAEPSSERPSRATAKLPASAPTSTPRLAALGVATVSVMAGMGRSALSNPARRRETLSLATSCVAVMVKAYVCLIRLSHA